MFAGHSKPPMTYNVSANEAAERARLAAAYEHFMNTEDPAKKNSVGQELIQTIFGKAAIDEDPLR